MSFFKQAVKEAPNVKAFEFDQHAYYCCPMTSERTGGWQVSLIQCMNFKTSTKDYMRNAFAHCVDCTHCWERAKRATIRERDLKLAAAEAEALRVGIKRA